MSAYEGQVFWYGTLAERQGWYVERLWPLAERLPIRSVPLEQFSGLLNEECWFDGKPPTHRAVLEKAKRVMQVDLAYPIILSSGGAVMDGRHRIMKAWLLGMRDVKVVQFCRDPEPDEVFSSEPSTDQGNR